MNHDQQINNAGEVMYPVYLTLGELDELVLLIDDGAVDEESLAGIRRKLHARRKRFGKRSAA